MPLGLLAEPLADELLFGVLARTRKALGAGHGRFAAAAWGTPSLSQCATLTSKVGGIWAPGSADGGRGLAAGHTNLAYHARWMTARDRAALESYVLGGSPAAAWRLAFRSRASLPPPRLMFCGDCAAEDLAAHGCAAWRRVHQLPAVLACGGHGTRLRASRVPALNATRLVECSPGMAGAADARHDLDLDLDLDLDVAVGLARTAGALLSDAGPAPPLRAASGLFRCAMRDCGWLMPDGGANGHFWRALGRRYGARFLEGVGMHPGDARARRALAAVWDGTGGESWPAAAPLLMLDFLGLSAGRFLGEWRRAAGGPPDRHAA